MNRIISSSHLLVILLALLSVFHAEADTGAMLFSPIDERGGDPRIRSINLLGDGRLAIATVSGLELYDGSHLQVYPDSTIPSATLRTYSGFHHLYTSHNDRYLWIKNKYSLKCFDLDHGRFIDSLQDINELLRTDGGIDDMFVAGGGNVWTLADGRLRCAATELTIGLDRNRMPLLDLFADNTTAYLFYGDGSVALHSIENGSAIHLSEPSADDEASDFMETSLLAQSGDSIYQIRNGSRGGLFVFNLTDRTWRRLSASPLRFNTMAIVDGEIYITTAEGILVIDSATGKTRHLYMLRTQTGNMLASEISTIATDRENGIWIGTLFRGVRHFHPSEFSYHRVPKRTAARHINPQQPNVFSDYGDGAVYISDNSTKLAISYADGMINIDSISNHARKYAGEYGNTGSFVTSNGSLCFNSDSCYEFFFRNEDSKDYIPVRPLITGIYVNGDIIGAESEQRKPSDIIASRTPGLSLDYDQNFITVEATAPSYARKNADYYYFLEGLDKKWSRVTGTGPNGRDLRICYNALPPGKYILRLKTATDGEAPESILPITIAAPWWATPWAYAAYAIFIILCLVTCIRIYISRTARKIALRQREENLLERIRHLIDEVDRYKAESAASESNKKESQNPETSDDRLTDNDRAFISKAIEAVERNMETPGYSVEDLSRDLCMDRTGLYRRLTTMLDKSPSYFIRDIRLRHAADMLLDGAMSVAEIAEATGFSSSSYFSKCFQSRYGCRPSEYSEKKANGILPNS